MTFDPAIRCRLHHGLRCDRPECAEEMAALRQAVETMTADTLPPRPYEWRYRPKSALPRGTREA